jgi:hypothetical protein
MGGEYYYIARSIASGKGFSNPFQIDTGPTAWMPPLYPYLIALLIKLFKFKKLITFTIVFLKNISLVFTGLVIFETAKKTLVKVRPEYAAAFYCFFVLLNFRWFFQLTHESWLLLLIMNIIFIVAVHLREHKIMLKEAIVWGALGGFSMLASPIVGMVWLALCIINMFFRINSKYLIYSAALFFLICTPWFVRNYVVFNKIIFMKSNLFHDLYHFNYENPYDGLVYEPFEYKCLLWTAKDNPDCLYRKVGEAEFMEIYKKKFFTALKNNPERFIQNVETRLLSAFLIFYPHSKYDKANILKTTLHALPFISILLLIVFKQSSTSSFIQTGMIIYFVYLLPYILVSYYFRYAIPLTPLKILFPFWALDFMIVKLNGLFKKQITTRS